MSDPVGSVRRTPVGERGQTAVDLIVGVSVFVVAVTVVVGFAPQLFEPYDDAETTVVADRVADDLVGDLLDSAEAAEPGGLNESCTAEFFGVNGSNSGCSFAPTLTDRFGVDSTYRINVTVEWNVTGDQDTEILCYTASNESVHRCGAAQLAVGPTVPDGQRSVATATRLVRVDDRPVLLKIRVWSS